MKTWIGSDFHWGHTNIMKFCPVTRARFNNDLKYMNEAMIREWNEIVQPEDEVYILGDIAFLPVNKAIEVMRRLNGTKILIEGNHDQKALQDTTFQQCFAEIHSYLDISYGGHKIIMSHYPFLEWDGMHRGSLHFHGHLHGNKTGQEHFRCKDVGMDATGVIVMQMEDAIKAIANNQIKSHH
jgi:calcineurin-like phosphoesterase family protein